MRGFTLIELILTIVLLGILSAVALPRFLNLAGDARAASAKATFAAFKTALASAQQVAELNNGGAQAISLKNASGIKSTYIYNGLIIGASNGVDLSNINYPASSPYILNLDAAYKAAASDHQICADIFLNLMGRRNTSSIVTETGNNKNCDQGALKNPGGPVADICTCFFGAGDYSGIGARCEYYLHYPKLNVDNRTSIIYFMTTSTDDVWKDYPAGTPILYIREGGVHKSKEK